MFFIGRFHVETSHRDRRCFVGAVAVGGEVGRVSAGLGDQPRHTTRLAGPDYGFRIEGEQNGMLIGLPVVRVDGRWVDVKIGSSRPQPVR